MRGAAYIAFLMCIVTGLIANTRPHIYITVWVFLGSENNLQSFPMSLHTSSDANRASATQTQAPAKIVRMHSLPSETSGGASAIGNNPAQHGDLQQYLAALAVRLPCSFLFGSRSAQSAEDSL
jgi:hypothetical protein